MGGRLNVTLNMGIGIVPIITNALAYAGIAYFAYKQYQKQELKPSVWKMIIVMLVGLFSFSFDWSMSNTMLRFAILPLGVWLIFLVCRGNKHRWQKYRSFAWLGFGANYLLLAATLLSIPLQNVLYPTDKLSTHIAKVNNASIIRLHPSAEEVSLNVESLKEQLSSMQEAQLKSDELYGKIVLESDQNNRQEQFPYLLIGTDSKWGSGLSTVIYVEMDGKGIITSTHDKQLYYRFEKSLLQEGISDG